jgi:hypothetical protein
MMTIRRTLAAAIAVAALAAPAASAQQDLRSPDAIDAAREQRQDIPRGGMTDAFLESDEYPFVPASPGHPSEVESFPQISPPAEAASSGGGGVDWTLVGLGSAGLLLFAGGVVALGTRTRPAPRRHLSA